MWKFKKIEMISLKELYFVVRWGGNFNFNFKLCTLVWRDIKPAKTFTHSHLAHVSFCRSLAKPIWRSFLSNIDKNVDDSLIFYVTSIILKSEMSHTLHDTQQNTYESHRQMLRKENTSDDTENRKIYCSCADNVRVSRLVKIHLI